MLQLWAYKGLDKLSLLVSVELWEEQEGQEEEEEGEEEKWKQIR